MPTDEVNSGKVLKDLAKSLDEKITFHQELVDRCTRVSNDLTGGPNEECSPDKSECGDSFTEILAHLIARFGNANSNLETVISNLETAI